MGVLLTPRELFQRATPSRLLFGDAASGKLGIEPGLLSDITHVGTGTGIVEVDGIATDAYSLVLRCDRGGEINASETANPGLLPKFSLSLDGGTTWERSRVVSDNRDEAIMDFTSAGLRFTFYNGDPAPSFVALDTYSLTSAACPDILAMIEAIEAEIIESAAGSFDPPITAAPANWRMHCARLVRWELYTKIGIQRQQDLKAHYPKTSYEWLQGLREGKYAVKAAARGVVEQAPGTSFVDFAKPQARDPWAPPV